MKKSYIDYSMSVIVQRALPDVRDGLKPVHRRILYVMKEIGLWNNGPYRKSANTVGEVLGKYHPHGDTSVYDAMVRMAQDWSMRYLLVEGQGNFGSVGGDSAAHMRYTEAKLHKIAKDVISNVDEYTVNFMPNYDGRLQEPTVLPSRLPNLLMNGAEGIAVGMATSIPTHNLTELMEALQYMVGKYFADNPVITNNELEEFVKKLASFSSYEDILNTEDKEMFGKSIYKSAMKILSYYPVFETAAEVDDLMKFVKGPDFPTKGTIYDKAEIRNMYLTGRGRVLIRGKAEIEENKNGRFSIVITELPYQVNDNRLVAKIADLVKNDKLELSDLRNETNREGIRIVADVKRGDNPNTILNNLYKFTELQTVFNANLLALVENQPVTLALKDILTYFIRFRIEVTVRAAVFTLENTKRRAHILEGLKRALDVLDEIIATIRASKDSNVAKEQLIKKFTFSPLQAQEILEMQLRRLAALERQKIDDEYKEVALLIEQYRVLLSSPENVLKKVDSELTEMKDKYGDKRLTRVVAGRPDELSAEDLVEKENVVVTVSKAGYVKRMPMDTYKSQGRGGKGVIGATTRGDDYISHIFYTNTHDDVLFFSNKGKVYSLKVYEIPEFARTAKGQPIVNLIALDAGEYVTSVLTRGEGGNVMDEDTIQEGEQGLEKQGVDYKFFFMCTTRGTVKKVDMKELAEIRKNGLIAIKLDESDELRWVRPTTGNTSILIATANGKCIRFDEGQVRELGRSARGVRGILLKGNDVVISMDTVRHKEDRVLVISEHGFGKLTPLDEYSSIGRGGQGVTTAKVVEKTGKIVVMRVIDHPQKELIVISQKGQVIRTEIEQIRETGRVASGVKIIRLGDDDKVAAVAVW
ncbi:MAG: DNA gyrase subunit A [bacterium]